MIGHETNKVGRDSLVEVLATPTLAALLCEFALHPDRRFYQRELVNRTDGSLYLVQRELARLERAGLIVREERGRQVEYHYNGLHPAATGLQDAVLKTIALGDRLKAALAGVKGIELAFIFGSLARGEETAESDIDVFVVGSLGMRDVATRIVPVMRDLGREPNIMVMTPAELQAKRMSGDHFVGIVLAEPKVWLVGDDDGLDAVLG